jgi:hypothetical protein
MHKRAKDLGVRIVRPFVKRGFCFLFATKGLGKTVRYNDTRDVINARLVV